MKFLFAFALFLSFSAIADVTVITYNMSQLKKKGVDLVACTKRRSSLQIDAIFNDPASPIYASKDFVLLIQESWTKRSFNDLKKASLKKYFTFYPDDYQKVKNTGQLIITNMKTLDIKSMPFSRDKYAKKGMIYARLALNNAKSIGVINVHTGYSDKTGFSEEHRRHFEELGQSIETLKSQTDYFVVGGDFNAGPDMAYKTVKFDAASVIWNDGIMLHMRNQGMKLLESVGVTWDETNNMLVRIPPLLLRLVNTYKNGYAGWDMKDSTIDHIFVPETTIVSRHELAFNKKVKLNCGKRDDKDGLLHLSDHYGVMAVINTEEMVEPSEIRTIDL